MNATPEVACIARPWRAPFPYPENLTSLVRAVVLSEDEKREDAAYQQAYALPQWLEDSDADIRLNEGEQESELLVRLKGTSPEEYQAFLSWAYKAIQAANLTDAPAWNYFSFEAALRDSWLVHFSDNANLIASEGFLHGVPTHEHERLALSTNYTSRTGRGDGFNFAFQPQDVKRFAFGRGSEPKYGKEAVMFRAPAAVFWHTGDEEPQAIFLGKTARQLVYLQHYNGMWSAGKRPSGAPVFSAERITPVINWVEANYDQYWRVLTGR